jgi:hypothetical protein
MGTFRRGPFEDAHGLTVAGYDQTMGEFSGRLEGVNDLGATLATDDGRLAFFPWDSVARIMLTMSGLWGWPKDARSMGIPLWVFPFTNSSGVRATPGHGATGRPRPPAL